MDLWLVFLFAIVVWPDISCSAASVEVHFEGKEGGFFLKHSARHSFPAVADLGATEAPAERQALLSVDRFTVMQTAQPVSVRATYGPFSTKQTVPARYVVPDPLDPPPPNASVPAAPLDVDPILAGHHLDMSAHVVRGAVARDSPVLRVLFHAGADPGGRRHPQRRLCIVLHASLGDRQPLTAACSPDGEDGVCLAQVTVPASWWPPFVLPGSPQPTKTPARLVQVAYSVLEPRDMDAGCVPRVQIQPITALGTVPLTPAVSPYRQLNADERVTLLLPHAPLYPLARLHLPVFLHPHGDTPVAVLVFKARVKKGVRLLGAESSSDQWNVSVELNPKHTVATVTAFRRDSPPPTKEQEVFTWLLEVGDASADLADGGRIVWSARYILEGQERHHRGTILESGHHRHTARIDIHKDDIQAVLPIAKGWDVLNTAVLTGRQVSQAMRVFIVSQAGKVADVTRQADCHSEDESVLKVSSSCSSVYVDGSELRGSSNASVVVKYGTYTGLARFIVWMPEFPLEVHVPDFRLSQVKGWRVPDDHPGGGKLKRSVDEKNAWRTDLSVGMDDFGNGMDNNRHSTCRLRFQQSPVEVYARFLASDQDSGRVSYFVNRRTWLHVTDLVEGLLRVADPRIASLHGRILQGRSMGRTEVQVLSPITGRVIGAKEIRVGNDKVAITRLKVSVVSGLQLSIVPDTTIENGYIAETSVTRKLTAQYQEGLLDIDLEFSDGTWTPLREVAVSDYHLLVDSLDPEVVAFAPMAASHHPRVIAVGEGHGDFLRVMLVTTEACRGAVRRGKPSNNAPLAVAAAHVEVDFSGNEVPQRPEFVQNDGGGVGMGVGHGLRDRKASRDMPSIPNDISIGIPMKDENNHEPTVQARQHHSAQSTSIGMRHHNPMHMTPLEIGMYVLLAAFCFAIVVFVVSCVVYASKFKPQPLEPSIPQPSFQPSCGTHKQLRESTTNAHDWVWLGRATLERASGQPAARSMHSNNNNNNNNNNVESKSKEDEQMHIMANPMNFAVVESEVQYMRPCFDNPNPVDLPPRVDSATYVKKEKPLLPQQELAFKDSSADMWQISPTPPPPPPRGLPDDADYRPPVPPHRNIGVTARIGPSRQHPGPLPGFQPEPPSRRHHHHHHHRNNRNHHHQQAKHLQNPTDRQESKDWQKDNDPSVEENPNEQTKPLPDPEADLQQHRHNSKEDASKNHHKRQSKEQHNETKDHNEKEDDDTVCNTTFVEFHAGIVGSGGAQKKKK